MLQSPSHVSSAIHQSLMLHFAALLKVTLLHGCVYAIYIVQMVANRAKHYMHKINLPKVLDLIKRPTKI